MMADVPDDETIALRATVIDGNMPQDTDALDAVTTLCGYA
jgi:hypothetical protein